MPAADSSAPAATPGAAPEARPEIHDQPMVETAERELSGLIGE